MMVFPVLVSYTVKKLIFVRILGCLVVNYMPVICGYFATYWENEWKYCKFKKTQVVATRPSERLGYQVLMSLVLCAKVGSPFGKNSSVHSRTDDQQSI